MKLRDIQILEHAARTAMAGNDDPLPEEQRGIKPLYIGLIGLTLIAAALLLFA